MSYHIVKITSYYKDFLSYYYQLHPQIVNKSYKEQQQHLMQQRFAWSDAYSEAFETLGKKSDEIVANAQVLQKQWAKENQLSSTDEIDILIAQLSKLKPDVIWLQDSYSFNGELIKTIKRKVPTIKLAIGNCCSPISPKYYKDFQSFDFITVCAPYFKHLLESKGLPECIVVPHAFDGRILNEINQENKPEYDFLFTGSIILDQHFHKERIAFIESLLQDRININLLVNLNQNSSKGLRARQAGYILTKTLDSVGLKNLYQSITPLNKVSKLEYFPSSSKVSKQLQEQIKNPVFGLQMFQALSDSKIAFNIHGDIAANFAANLRMFEATGIGSCLLTDWKPDINKYFTDEIEIVTYKSFDEAKDKIKYLLDHPEELEKIAKNGQARTLNEHTFINRASIIDEKINQLLAH
ncbi:CgeB family protein [Carboxylicivirga caseinilyticus]|uniref:CgeB family protein n=1 Tax=Carboxylicivirga caseinilyticus TaxID=3417572 RepID=UPI003D3319D2|nr:glycosyltransferase family 1 protein [Marinilabiliaceae bacterium A049]